MTYEDWVKACKWAYSQHKGDVLGWWPTMESWFEFSNAVRRSGGWGYPIPDVVFNPVTGHDVKIHIPDQWNSREWPGYDQVEVRIGSETRIRAALPAPTFRDHPDFVAATAEPATAEPSAPLVVDIRALMLQADASPSNTAWAKAVTDDGVYTISVHRAQSAVAAST